MTSPAIALTWEIWRRHRTRLITMVITLFAFALFYPKLCALSGINLNSPNVLADSVPQLEQGPMWLKVFRIATFLFLLIGPVLCMMLSLMYVIWVFTFTDFNPKQPFTFSTRLFTLPVSTRFLAGWLMAAGIVTVLAIHMGWSRMVRIPHTEVFGPLMEGSGALAWITLLVLSQATVWSLEAFPFFRGLVICALFYCFLGYGTLSLENFLKQNRPWFLSSLLLAGGALAYTGLSKIRHGNWQTWRWKWNIPSGAAAYRAPQKFHSAADAQQWLDWRSYGRRLFLCVSALVVAPIFLVVTEVILNGPLDGEVTRNWCLYLLSVPLFIHFCHGISPQRPLLSLVAHRPLTNAEIVMSILKTLTKSTLLSWIVTAAAIGVVLLLGDAAENTKWLAKDLPPIAGLLLLAGLIFLTWRFSVINLGFSLTGNLWASCIPALTTVGFILVFLSFNYLLRQPAYHETVFRVLVGLLGSLVLLKLILAQWAFRVALRKQLLTRSAVNKYLITCAALGLLFLVPTAILLRHDKGVVPLCLFIILLLPLARIGFAPIALNFSRHR